MGAYRARLRADLHLRALSDEITAALRRADRLGRIERDRLRQFPDSRAVFAYLTANVPGLRLPSADEEPKDKASADLAYSSAVKWLQERRRGKDFPLVEKENAEYGFRRNLRGMRSIGLTACVLAGTLSAMALFDGHRDLAVALADLSGAKSWHTLTEISPPIVAATIVDLIAIVGWLVIVKDQWVRDAGNQYARALLACCDKLASVRPREAKPRTRRQSRGPQKVT